MAEFCGAGAAAIFGFFRTLILLNNEKNDKMTDLAMSHHRLMRTTISGIPMKEEQHTTANKETQNYDVPLLHPQLGNSTETLILKWNSPKLDLAHMRYCSSAVRISPLEVNSRHSGNYFFNFDNYS